jgi:RimJ/RimL family protein N-acetyltransferase
MLIKYQNLTIRNATAADTEQLITWYNDGNIMAQFGYPNGMGLEYKPEETSQDNADDTDDHLHIIELDGKPIGEMNYRSFCYPDGIIELDGKPIDEFSYRNMEGAFEPGIKICDLSARDKGYGTKLLILFIDALFRYHGCEKIILDTDMKNERAKHVYEKKLGFRVLGVQKNPSLDESEYYASVIYFEMNKADWLASRKNPEYTHSRAE